MAVARRPLPRIAVPVLVIKLGCDGSLSIISAARSAGGGGLDEDDEAIVRLYNDGKGSEPIAEIKSPSEQDDARSEDLRDGRMRSCTRRYEGKVNKSGMESEKDVPDARKVFKAILEAIVVVVSWRRRQYRNSFANRPNYVSVPSLFLLPSLCSIFLVTQFCLCQDIGWEDCYF